VSVQLHMSHEPIEALLLMPGCEIIPRFPTSARLGEIGDAPSTYRSAHGECLCDSLQAITALEIRHCSFESLYQAALLHGEHAAEILGVELFLKRQVGRRREYAVATIAAQLPVPSFQHVMLLQLRTIPGVEVHFASQDVGSPPRLSVTTLHGDRVLSHLETSKPSHMRGIERSTNSYVTIPTYRSQNSTRNSRASTRNLKTSMTAILLGFAAIFNDCAFEYGTHRPLSTGYATIFSEL
jgi:hypothetical protein